MYFPEELTDEDMRLRLKEWLLTGFEMHGGWSTTGKHTDAVIWGRSALTAQSLDGKRYNFLAVYGEDQRKCSWYYKKGDTWSRVYQHELP